VKQLFSGFIETQDAEGRAVIELRTEIGGPLIAHVVGPLLLSAAFYFNGTEKSSAPWWFYALIAGVSLLALPITLWRHYRSRVRVTVDRLQSRLFIATKAGEATLLMRDIEKAAFDMSPGLGEGTGYRLRFTLHGGERVPVTPWYCTYRERDVTRAIEAIRRALAKRPEMV